VRYTGETRVRIYGNTEEGQRYLKLATKMMGEVYNQDIKLGQLQQSQRQRVLPNGVIIAVHYNSWMPSIDITLPPNPGVPDEEQGEIVIEFYQFPASLSGTTVYPVMFNADLTAFQDFEPPFGESQTIEALPAGTIIGARRLENEGYVLDRQLYYVRESSDDGVEFQDVELPDATTRRYQHELILSSPRGSYRRGEIVLHVSANTEHVFVLVEECLDAGSDVQLTLYLDAIRFDGVRDYTLQVGPSFLRAPVQTHTFRDKIAAWSRGVYILRKPNPAGNGYELIKWRSLDDADWTITTFPVGVTPEYILAGPLGPYIIDFTDSDEWRLSLLSPTDGSPQQKATIAGEEQAWQYTIEDYLPEGAGFTEVRFAAGADNIYIALNRTDNSGITLSASVVDIYTAGLTRLRRVESPQIADRVGAPFENGFTLPRGDARLLDAL